MNAPVPAWRLALDAAADADYDANPGTTAPPQIASELRRRLPPPPPAAEQAA